MKNYCKFLLATLLVGCFTTLSAQEQESGPQTNDLEHTSLVGWAEAKFGMTVDEVLSAVPNAEQLTLKKSVLRRLKKDGANEITAVKINDFELPIGPRGRRDFSVRFSFEYDSESEAVGGLVQVQLSYSWHRPENVANEIMGPLVTKYGSPTLTDLEVGSELSLFDRSFSHTYRSDRPKGNIWEFTDGSYIALIWTENTDGMSLNPLRIKYRTRKPTTTKLDGF